MIFYYFFSYRKINILRFEILSKWRLLAVWRSPLKITL